MKIGCCSYSYREFLQSGEMSLEQFIDISADLGIEGVELTSYYFPNTDKKYLNSLKRRCLIKGVDVSGAAVGCKMTLADDDERAEQIAMVKEWLGHALTLGAPQMRGIRRRDSPGSHRRGSLRLGGRGVQGMRSGCCRRRRGDGIGKPRRNNEYFSPGDPADRGR